MISGQKEEIGGGSGRRELTLTRMGSNGSLHHLFSLTPWQVENTFHSHGYATKDANGRLKLQKFKESLFDADVEISDDMFLLKAEDAQKLREPPRLAQLVLRPDQVGARSGECAS